MLNLNDISSASTGVRRGYKCTSTFQKIFLLLINIIILRNEVHSGHGINFQMHICVYEIDVAMKGALHKVTPIRRYFQSF